MRTKCLACFFFDKFAARVCTHVAVHRGRNGSMSAIRETQAAASTRLLGLRPASCGLDNLLDALARAN